MNLFLKKNRNSKMIVLDIPLLVENRLYKKKDVLILVKSDRNKIIKRLKKRRNYNKIILKKLKVNQANLSKKKKLANFIIENNFSVNTMKYKIKLLKERIFYERNSS